MILSLKVTPIYFPHAISGVSIKTGGPSKIMLSLSSFSMILFSQRIGNARGFLYKGEGLFSSNRFLPESKIDRVLQKARSAKAKEEYEKESTKEERAIGKNYVCRGNLVSYTYDRRKRKV